MSAATDLCRKLLRASEDGDEAAFRECYSPDARIWHDFDGLETHEAGAQSVDENIRTMRWMHRVTKFIKYETLRLERTETGFVETHKLSGETNLGETFSAVACVIGTVESGKIVRFEEFLNPANLSALNRVPKPG